MLAYNGYSRFDMLLSKAAAIAALGVAMFPCGCEDHEELIPYVHYLSAVVMFLILAYFSYEFYQRAKDKGHLRAKARAWIYLFCCIAIGLAIAILGVDGLSGGLLSHRFTRLTFYGETTGLVAFGISWLVASHVLPGITRPEERVSLLS